VYNSTSTLHHRVTLCYSGDQGLLKKFFALVGMGVGGALAYTWYEPEFRTKVEMNVLFAREVLHFIDKFIPPRSQVLGEYVHLLLSSSRGSTISLWVICDSLCCHLIVVVVVVVWRTSDGVYRNENDYC